MLASCTVAVAAPAVGPVQARAARASARPAFPDIAAAIGVARFSSAGIGSSVSASRRPTRLAAKAKKGAPEGAKPAPKEEKPKSAPSSESADPAVIELEAEEKMQKAVEAVRRNFGTIRTGRANSAMLDRIQVDYYGSMTALKGMANVSTPDAQTIVIQPFDKAALKDIERAIQMSDLGINPSNDGNLIRLNIPQLTQERRKEMTKQVGKLAEEGKIALRNVRRDALKNVEKIEKDKVLSEDDATKLKDKIQKLTDGFVKQVEEIESSKNKELMQV